MKQFLLALSLIATLHTTAQTADEIIQKYTNTLGGLDAFDKVKTAKISGSITTNGKTYPITTQLVNGRSMRTDVTVAGQQIINVYDNGKGWKINPFAGAPVAQDVTGTELVSYKAQASLANHLSDYKRRGHEVTLAGLDPVNGAPAYKIKLVNKDDGKTTYYFIDSTTSLLVKSTTIREISGTPYGAETTYSDFRTINGLQFAMHILVTVEGKPFQELIFDRIDLNVPVDEKIFTRPRS